MATAETATEIRIFSVDVPQEQLDDVRRGIAATRRPGKELVADRPRGVQLATLQHSTRSRCLSRAERISAPGDGRTNPGGGAAARGRLTTTTPERTTHEH